MRRTVALAAALVAALTASGSYPAPRAALAWDCWVDSLDTGGIRCILDRDAPPPLPPDYGDDDEAAEVLLELVHDYLHRGNPARASELVRERAHLLRRNDLWLVRLSAPPLDSSWVESRPQRLVRALLCRGAPDCRVRFHH